MIITKCYVQDFGKLHEQTFDFSNGLNIINQQNGWGKSTLATFIKSVLFGLNSTTKKDLDENDRQKYTPWDKNKFGGYVEFCLDNKNYRLERWFGTKANQDSATLYNLETNKVCSAFTPNIMEEFFGINAETYERSTYISQGKISTELNDGLRAKLGNLLQNETENNYKKAIELINSKRKEKQVFKGKGGEIENIRIQIDELTKKQFEALEKQKILTEKQFEFDEEEKQLAILKNEIEKTEKEIKVLDNLQTQNAEIEHYESLQQQLESLKKDYETEIKFFNNKMPDELTLQRTQTDINNFNNKQVELASTKQLNISVEQENLNRFFAKHIPTDKEIDDFVELSNKLTGKEKLLQTPKILPQQIERTQPKTYFHFYLMLGILIAAAGIAFIGLSNIIVGGVITFIGVVCFVVGLIAKAKTKQKQEKQIAQQNLNSRRADIEFNKNLTKLNFETEELKRQLNSFISLFMIPTSSPLIDLLTIKSNKEHFDNLKKQNDRILKTQNNLNQELVQIKSTLDKFFANYFSDQTSGYQTMLNSIEFRMSNLKRIKQEMEEQTQKVEKYIKLKNIDITKKITQTDLQKHSALNNLKTSTMEQFNTLNARHGQTLANIKTLTIETSNLDLIESEIASLKEKEQAVAKQVEILDYVKKFLENANDTLTSKYISPMMQNFNKYASLLSAEGLSEISMDTNLTLTFEQKGAFRDKKFLSAGYRDIVDLCLRFALVDAIFPNEKPTIVLDDPFVNLDDENTQKGLNLIKKIAEEKQIIYLVCNSSRS